MSRLDPDPFSVHITIMRSLSLHARRTVRERNGLPSILMFVFLLGEPEANGMLMNGGAPMPSERSSFLARMGTFGSSIGSYGTFGDYNNYKHTSGFRLFRQRWYAMFVKRLLHSKRHKLALVSQLLLPLVFTLFALISAKTVPQPKDSPPLTLSTHNFLDNNVSWWANR